MTKKKKLIAIGLCLVILAATILNGTAAYFTDTQEVSNTFTSGNVEIELDEAKVEKNNIGDLVAKGTERFEPTETEKTQNYGTIYPGMKITKDPTITNVGNEKAYVAAKIVINNTGAQDLTSLLSGGVLEGITPVATQDAVENAIDAGDEYVVYVKIDNTAKTNTIYVFAKTAVDANEKVVLFDKVTIPTNWDNDEMSLINSLRIDVTGYGIQTYGFANGYEAAITAFGTVFNFA